MKTPFVISNGKFYITIVASGIHPLIPLVDGMCINTFPKIKKAFLPLDDVIAWHEKEIKAWQGDHSHSIKCLELLKQARARLVANAEKAIKRN